MKTRMPKLLKPSTGRRAPLSSLRGGHVAFGAGGTRAFSDPSTMTAPDQAFGAAMAMPQGGTPPVMPAMPTES